VVLRIGFNPTRSTSPCYNNYTFIQYTVIQKIHTFTYIHKNESKHSVQTRKPSLKVVPTTIATFSFFDLEL